MYVKIVAAQLKIDFKSFFEGCLYVTGRGYYIFQNLSLSTVEESQVRILYFIKKIIHFVF
jgi:hypothetical protein